MPTPFAAPARDAAAPDAADALDRRCLHGVARRDRDAFERLYRAQHPRLARFLRRFTARTDLIDDVVNEAMWVVWRNAGDFRGESKVSTWVTGIAYRCMLQALRRGTPADEFGESALDDRERRDLHDAATDPAPERELHDWLARGLRSLPEDQRVTLELAYFMGQSCEEIAAVMDCAVGTVKARMFHARTRLRSVLPALAAATPAAKGASK